MNAQNAWVDSGSLFLPDSVILKIKELNKTENRFLPNGRDLYIIGQDNICTILFGDTNSFMDLWHNKYLITGKAIDVKGHGIVFRVDNYRLLKQ